MKHNNKKKIEELFIDENLVAPDSLKTDVFNAIHNLELFGSFAELFFEAPLGYFDSKESSDENQ